MEVSTIKEQEKLINSIIENQIFLIQTRANIYWGLKTSFKKNNKEVLLQFEKDGIFICDAFIIPYFVLISNPQIDIICENALEIFKEMQEEWPNLK